MLANKYIKNRFPIIAMDIRKAILALSVIAFSQGHAAERPDSASLMLDEVVVTGSNKAPRRVCCPTPSVS